MIFHSKIISIGNEASRFFEEGILLVFSAQSVMTQIKNYSVMIEDNHLEGTISVGQTLMIGKESFKITAVGNIAQQNIREMGHTTFKADGSTVAELPGSIYLEKKKIPEIKAGDCMIIK